MYKELFLNLKKSFFTQVPLIVSGFIVSILTTRLLGPEGKGIWGYFFNGVSLALMFLSFNIHIGVTYFLSKKTRLKELILSNSLAIAFVVSISIVSLLFLSSLNDSLFNLFIPKTIITTKYIIYFTGITVLNFNTTVVNSILQGLKDFTSVNRFNLINGTLNLLFFSILFFFNSAKELKIDTLLNVVIISLIIAFLFSLYELKRKHALIINYKIIKPVVILIILKYSLKNNISILINFFNYRLDIWLIMYFGLSLNKLGFYFLAVNLGQLLWLGSNTIGSVIMPYYTQKTIDSESKAAYIKIQKINFITLLLGCICLGFIAPYFIPFVYGEEFKHAVIPLLILLPGILFSGLTKPIGTFLASRNKNHINTIATFTGLIMTLLVNIITIPKLGINGAALSSTISYFTIFLIVFLFNLKFQA